jgi:hypothetical protein
MTSRPYGTELGIPVGHFKPGDRNELGDYIFDPAWSGRWLWPWGCRIIRFPDPRL